MFGILGVVLALSMVIAIQPVSKASTVHDEIIAAVKAHGTYTSIDNSDFSTDAIDDRVIKAGAIGSSEIATDAIDADAIKDGAIDAGAIADDAIDAGALKTDAIDADALATDAVNEIRDAGSVDQERIFSFTVDSKHGTTPITDAVLIPDTGVVIVGRAEAVMVRDTDDNNSGSPSLTLKCVNSDGSITSLGTLNNLNDKISTAFTCKAVRMDLGAGGNADDGVGALISIYVDNWPAV